jgi:hypothetical protein
MPSNPRHTRDAFRRATLPDTTAYLIAFKARKRKDTKFKCPITGEMSSIRFANVDHIYPFANLMDDFLATKGLSREDVPLAWPYADTPEIADPELKTEWIEYHRDYACVHVTSTEGNTMKADQRVEYEGDCLREFFNDWFQD